MQNKQENYFDAMKQGIVYDQKQYTQVRKTIRRFRILFTGIGTKTVLTPSF